MRYLLCGINAKYIHSNLAVFCLKAYAEANVPGAGKNVWNGRETDETGDGKAEAAAGPEFVIKEYTINHYVENILQDLYEEKADVIVFSCYIWNIDYVRELAEELKKVSPGVQIWAGGPEVSYDAERFLRENPTVDLVMQGEGERTFAALVMKMEEMTVGVTGKNTAHEMVVGVAGKNTAHEMPDGVAGGDAAHDMPAGVAWREPAGGTAGGGEMASDNAPGGRETALPDKNVLIYNTGFAPVMDMDEIPFVYEDFHLFEHKIIYYESSRGCPFSCSYCLSSVDKTVRFPFAVKGSAGTETVSGCRSAAGKVCGPDI